MDVSGGKDVENQNILIWGKHGGLNQQWDLVYADEWKGEPVKGELNEKFGLYVERDFHVVTQLKSNRYLDIVGANFVIKTPNSFKTQIWYFDQRSLTIKSRSNTGKSWHIQNSGTAQNMQIYNTNSQWY
jgi:hypothetical protein